ncbi:hypothetical protein PoB_001858600 [Plakobranchus ocellatus]|uniref:Uncharacterized protein n=1 Tax=Plakobranchus ocellatus TaxID=259542 RepID=A0AAV3ZBP0_9GAST|nr:hypothetical protein PoB_001858600 [Plakobranchus ocellatus]
MDKRLYTASPQQGDHRLSGRPSGQGADGGARTRDRWIPVDLRADALATVPPTPLRTGKYMKRKETEKERNPQVLKYSYRKLLKRFRNCWRSI